MPLYMIKRCDMLTAPYITFFGMPIISQQTRSYLMTNGFYPASYTWLRKYLLSEQTEMAYIHLPDFYSEPSRTWDSIRARTYLPNYTLLSVRHILAIIESEQEAERQRRSAVRHEARSFNTSEDDNLPINAHTESPEDRVVDWLYVGSLLSELTPQQRNHIYENVILGLTHAEIAEGASVSRQTITYRIGQIRRHIKRLLCVFEKGED